MKKFILTCCSTVDMSSDYLKQNDIPYISFHYIMDGKEYKDDLGKTMSFSEFYDLVESGSMPTTSQINANEYMEFFEPFLEKGKDILHISLSSGLSGSCNSAFIAKETLKQKFPERKIYIVDSLGASSGSGMLIDMAKDLRDKGLSIAEVYNFLEENKLHIHHWFYSTDLKHYKRGGRISAAQAAMGILLNICPLLNMNYEGKLIPRMKIRGRKKVIKVIVQKMEEHAKSGINYSGKCFISHSNSLEDALLVKELVENTFPNVIKPIIINSIGTTIGSHTGKGTVALFFLGDKRID